MAQDVARERCAMRFERLELRARPPDRRYHARASASRSSEGQHPLSHALASAEIACKAAKDRGRNRVEIYADGDQSIVRRYTDLTLVGTVRSALLDQRFRLEAQPIVPLNGAPPHPKYELLLRMTDEAGNSVPPDKFLSRRRALPARAGDRSLGRPPCHRDAEAASPSSLAAQQATASPSTFRASRSATQEFARFHREHAAGRQAAARACCRSRSPRPRPSPTSCAPKR